MFGKPFISAIGLNQYLFAKNLKVHTHFPRFDCINSHDIFDDLQLLQGCSSITLHRILLALQTLHAFFARDLVRISFVGGALGVDAPLILEA